MALWILLPVFLGLLLSAAVGLQLFQDGSSYLVEMLIDHSAVRHGRLSVLLFQYPTIFLIKLLHQRELDPLVTLPVVRLAFNLNYALTPFFSLLLSWLVVHKKREELFIWAVLVILFVNLVNFSWVSELLISVQLAFPLLLAMLQNPAGKAFRFLLIFLVPFFFFLHPLVVIIYLVFAVASAYIAYRQPSQRKSAVLNLIVFLLAAAARGIYSYLTLNLYEVSFAASGEITEYFVVSRLENLLFLLTAIEIAAFVLMSRSISKLNTSFVKLLTIAVACQLFVQLMLAANFLVRGNLFLLIVLACVGLAAYVFAWRALRRTLFDRGRLLYLTCALLAGSAGFLLMAQYASAERQFTLKMGLDLFVALLIMSIAVLDSLREVTSDEGVLRFRLAVALSAIFALAITAKSAMWYISVQRLEQTLSTTNGACAEMSSADFRWLQNSPYTMINNWSLPSLALVVQDEQPRKALLAQNDCQIFLESGMIQVDPWSIFSKEFLVPPLGLSSESNRH